MLPAFILPAKRIFAYHGIKQRFWLVATEPNIRVQQKLAHCWHCSRKERFMQIYLESQVTMHLANAKIIAESHFKTYLRFAAKNTSTCHPLWCLQKILEKWVDKHLKYNSQLWKMGKIKGFKHYKFNKVIHLFILKLVSCKVSFRFKGYSFKWNV